MSNYIIIGGELYHYGVPGMKWGVRNAEVSNARKEYRRAARQERRTAYTGIGWKRMQKADAAHEAAKSAYANLATAKAQAKAGKAKTQEKAEKAEFKSYVKSMRKGGLPGSAADIGGRSRGLYDKLSADKGKEYADRVAKKVQNQAVGALAGTAALAVGSSIALAILNRRM